MVMKYFKHIINNFLEMFFYPSPQFKKHDAVQRITGGAIMIVLRTQRATKKLPGQVVCQWFDREKKVSIERTIPLQELKLFDWYNPS